MMLPFGFGEMKRKETHPAQWVGLKALKRGLGVGGNKSKRKR